MLNFSCLISLLKWKGQNHDWPWAVTTASCIGASRKGGASQSSLLLSVLFTEAATLSVRKRRCKSKEESTMYLFPAVSDACDRKKREGLCFCPNFSIYTPCDLGRSSFLRMFPRLCNENSICIRGQLWRMVTWARIPESVFILSPTKPRGAFAAGRVFGEMVPVPGSQSEVRRECAINAVRQEWVKFEWILITTGIFLYVGDGPTF